MLSQGMDVFSVRTHRLAKSMYTLSETEKSRYSDDGYEAKKQPGIHQTLKPIYRTVWRLLNVQLAKKPLIQMFCVLKQNKGWQIADSPCPMR